MRQNLKTKLQFINIIASMILSLIKSDRIAKVDAALSEARQVISRVTFNSSLINIGRWVNRPDFDPVCWANGNRNLIC